MKKTIASLVVLSALFASTAQAQTTPPKSCFDLFLRGGFTGDGEYTIQPGDAPMQVFCHSLNPDGWPVDFITLKNTGGDFNFGQFTAGGGVGGTDVRTWYRKVRFDPATMTLDIADKTFADSNGGMVAYGSGVTSMPLGVAMDCVWDWSQTGVANIDLTGTGFEINSSVFYTHGYNSAGTATAKGVTTQLIPNDQSFVVQKAQAVTLTGGGYCGAAGPAGFNSNLFFWPFASGGVLAVNVKWVGLPVP